MSCGLGACGRTNVTEPAPGLVHGSKLRASWPVELRRDRFHCYLCYVLPLRFGPIERCPHPTTDGDDCRLVKGHSPPCKSEKDGRPEKEAASTRDGTPKLAGAKARRHPMWEKRKRVGPHR